MNIEFSTVKLELSRDELISVYWALKREILRAIKDHWCNHPAIFRTEEHRLKILVPISVLLGLETQEQLMAEFEKAISDATPF